MLDKSMATNMRATLPAQNGIGWAVMQMQYGARVRRTGWNGKGVYIFLQERNVVNTVKHMYDMEPCVIMRTASATTIPWTCSQTDLLATDWECA